MVAVLTLRVFEQRVAALRRGADQKPVWQRAGEALLIEHGWLRRDDFCARVMVGEGDEATIRWERVGGVLADAVAGSFAGGDVVVLAFAVALGTDRFGLSQMDDDGRRRMLAAVVTAVRDWKLGER